MWEIIDNNGTIHSGNEDEMKLAFQIMTCQIEATPDDIECWEYEWEGDLKLVEVHNTYR